MARLAFGAWLVAMVGGLIAVSVGATQDGYGWAILLGATAGLTAVASMWALCRRVLD